MSYEIRFKDSARRELLGLPDQILNRIRTAIDKLSLNPRPPGVKKM